MAPSPGSWPPGSGGVTANPPTIFARAIAGSDAYDAQFAALIAQGLAVEDAYWELAAADVVDAAAILRPVYDTSGGTDGFVSIEVAPELARDTDARSPRPGDCTNGSPDRTCS